MDEHEITLRTTYYFLKSAIVNLLIAVCTLNLLVLGSIVEFLLPADDDVIVNSPATYTINGQSVFKSTQSRVERG